MDVPAISSDMCSESNEIAEPLLNKSYSDSLRDSFNRVDYQENTDNSDCSHNDTVDQLSATTISCFSDNNKSNGVDNQSLTFQNSDSGLYGGVKEQSINGQTSNAGSDSTEVREKSLTPDPTFSDIISSSISDGESIGVVHQLITSKCSDIDIDSLDVFDGLLDETVITSNSVAESESYPNLTGIVDQSLTSACSHSESSGMVEEALDRRNPDADLSSDSVIIVSDLEADSVVNQSLISTDSERDYDEESDEPDYPYESDNPYESDGEGVEIVSDDDSSQADRSFDIPDFVS